MIEAGEVLVLEGRDDGTRQRHGACLNRISLSLGALQEHLGEYVEGVLREAVAAFEIRSDERVVDFIERAGQLFAVASSPLAAADKPHELALGEGYLTADRATVIGMLLEDRHEYLMCKRSRLP